jgi:hypothetical protein
MAKSEAFAWKALGLGPRFRVEIAEAGMTLHRNEATTFLPYAKIARVHLLEVPGSSPAAQLDVELVDAAGKGIAFHAAAGMGSHEELAQCRRAAAALLRRLAHAKPAVKVYEGMRKDRPLRYLAVAMIVMAVPALVWAFDRFLLGNPERAASLGIVLGACFLFGTLWTLWRNRKTTSTPIGEALSKLEDGEGE